MSRLVSIAPLILFAVVAAYFAIGFTKNASILPSALIDKPVPTFDLPPLKDTKPGLATADLKDDVVLVNMFASWCVPCRAEHPLLMQLARDKIVPIIGLNWKDRKSDAIAWLDELGDPYARIGHDPSGRTGIDWGVYGVPETFVIDKLGVIRYKQVGPLDNKAIEEIILPLLDELS